MREYRGSLKTAGKNSPEIKPSRVLFGLIEGTILICPINFPKTKAKTSDKTEISRTVKKKLREKSSVMVFTSKIFTKITAKIIQTKILFLFFCLNSSMDEIIKMPYKPS